MTTHAKKRGNSKARSVRDWGHGMNVDILSMPAWTMVSQSCYISSSVFRMANYHQSIEVHILCRGLRQRRENSKTPMTMLKTKREWLCRVGLAKERQEDLSTYKESVSSGFDEQWCLDQRRRVARRGRRRRRERKQRRSIMQMSMIIVWCETSLQKCMTVKIVSTRSKLTMILQIHDSSHYPWRGHKPMLGLKRFFLLISSLEYLGNIV